MTIGARGSRQRVVFVVVVAEQRLQLELGLLAGLDEQHLGAERLGDELDHLVGERLRAGDHLARVEQQAHEVGRRAVQLRRELLDGAAALDDDLALGDGRVGRRELRHRRGPEVLEVATTTLLAPGPLTLRAGATATAGTATGTTGTATGTTTAATGTTAGTATGTLEAAAATAAATTGALEAAATATAATTGALEAAATAAAGPRGPPAPPEPGTTRGPGGGGIAGRPPGRRRDRTSGHAARRGRAARAAPPARPARRPPARARGRGRVGAAAAGRSARSRSGRGRRRGSRRGRGRRGRPPPGRLRRGRGAGAPASGITPVERTTRCGASAGSASAARRLDRRRGRRGLVGGASGRGASTAGSAWAFGLGAARLRLGLGLGLLDDRLAAQALGVGQAPDAVRGGIVDARRVALDADLQALGEIEHDLVLDAELSRQLVDPDLLRGQARCLLPLLLVTSVSPRRRAGCSSVARSSVAAAPGRRLAAAAPRRGTSAGWSRQSQAPRPGPAPGSSPAGGAADAHQLRPTAATRRHPMQVRTGSTAVAR